MKNVPTLRFQEFSESWMFKKIGDITSLVKALLDKNVDKTEKK